MKHLRRRAKRSGKRWSWSIGSTSMERSQATVLEVNTVLWKKKLEDQMPELQGEIDFLKIKRLSSDEILTEAQDLYSRWSDLGSEEKRKGVENITEKITIGKDDVTIDPCYLPSSSEIVAEKQRGLRGSLLASHMQLKGQLGNCSNMLSEQEGGRIGQPYGQPMRLRRDGKFRDFALESTWRARRESNSGLGFRRDTVPWLLRNSVADEA